MNTKLPGNLRKQAARTFNHGKWDLTKMMGTFRRKLESKECAFATINSNSKGINGSQFTSSVLLNNSEKNLCIFCCGAHTSSKCQTVLNTKARKDTLFKNKVCFIYFTQVYFSSMCTCQYCCRSNEGHYHSSIFLSV